MSDIQWKPYLIQPNQSVNLSDWDPTKTPAWKADKEAALQRLEQLNDELEALQELSCTARVCRIGIPDRFVEQGSQKQLRAKYSLDAQGIAATVKRTLADGRP